MKYDLAKLMKKYLEENKKIIKKSNEIPKSMDDLNKEESDKVLSYKQKHSGNPRNVERLRDELEALFKIHIERKIIYLISNKFAEKVRNELKIYLNDEEKLFKIVPEKAKDRNPYDTGNTYFSEIVKEVGDKLRDSKITLGSYLNPSDEETFLALKILSEDEGTNDRTYGVFTDPKITSENNIVINDKLFLDKVSNLESLFSFDFSKGSLKRKLYALFGMVKYAELTDAQLKKIIDLADITLVHEVGHMYDFYTKNNAKEFFVEKLASRFSIDTSDDLFYDEFDRYDESSYSGSGNAYIRRNLESITKYEHRSKKLYLNTTSVSGQTEILVRIDAVKNWLYQNKKVLKTRNDDLNYKHIELWKKGCEYREESLPVSAIQLYYIIDWLNIYMSRDKESAHRLIAETFNSVR